MNTLIGWTYYVPHEFTHRDRATASMDQCAEAKHDTANGLPVQLVAERLVPELRSSGASCRFTGFPLVTGHAAQVTDFDFSPFNSQMLATGSEDCMVKLWNVPSVEELDNNLRLSQSVLDLGPVRVS